MRRTVSAIATVLLARGQTKDGVPPERGVFMQNDLAIVISENLAHNFFRNEVDQR